ncbi:MAG: hypothetical protein WAM62_10190 [Pseudolabrys sp.]
MAHQGKREKINIDFSTSDLIKIFQQIVRDSATAGEKTVELPTAFLLDIAEALDHVKKSGGNPGKSFDVRFSELLAIRAARREYRKLRSTGLSSKDALARIARWPIFEKKAPKTLKSDMQRRKHR